jgi:hypothetical protein
MDTSRYVYFMYSEEYISKKNKIESSIGRRFVLGTVVVNGVKKSYAFMSTSKHFMNEYPDAKIVAEGYNTKMNYTAPYAEAKRGN